MEGTDSVKNAGCVYSKEKGGCNLGCGTDGFVERVSLLRNEIGYCTGAYQEEKSKIAGTMKMVFSMVEIGDECQSPEAGCSKYFKYCHCVCIEHLIWTVNSSND